MRTLLVALLAVVLSPSFAHAGGSKVAQLLVRNENSVTPNGSSSSPNIELLAVFLDINPEDLNLRSIDQAALLAAGVRLVGPKGVAVFPTKIGTHTIYAFYLPLGLNHDFDLDDIQVASATVNVRAGTTTVRVRGSSSTGATIITNGSP